MPAMQSIDRVFFGIFWFRAGDQSDCHGGRRADLCVRGRGMDTALLHTSRRCSRGGCAVDQIPGVKEEREFASRASFGAGGFVFGKILT